MQPVTVAISPAGISYLLQTLIGNQVAKALEDNLTPPNYSFTVPDFNYLPGGDAFEHDYSGITISLSGGAFKSFTPVFSGCVQGPDDNSQFTISMTVSNLDMDYNWNESFTSQLFTWNRGGMKVPAGQPTPNNNNYGYSVNLPSLSITAVFKLSVVGGAYELTYVSSSADPGNPQPNIPGASILNQQQATCGYAAHISAATVQQLDNMDYGGCVAAALKPIFASIGQSGSLGPVQFDFLAPGDSGLAFPGGGGVQLGAKGTVSVNGSPFPATPPADLALPSIPTGNPAKHAAYYIQDYEVDALFWGFFAAGILKATLAPGDLKDPQALKTETYAGGSLNILPMKYPNAFMTADLTAKAAPTVFFTTIYQFTDASLARIQKDMGSAWAQYSDEISELNPGTYSSQSGLEAQLQAIDPGLMTYAAAIENDTAVTGIIAQHDVRCVLNVLKGGQPVPVITFDVAQTFAMQGLQLGLSSTKTTQSVVFDFIQPSDIFPKPTFVSSTLPGVNNADFSDVWDALRPNWQDVFAQVGTAGVPLPRIPGFDFLFDQATVAVNPAVAGADGYVAITTDLTYAPEGLAPAVRRAIARRSAVLVEA
jgi:hypothetical protein